MKVMEQHSTGSKSVDIILWIGGIYFGALGHFAQDISMQDIYYGIASISVAIVACKNAWEWREKWNNRKENGK
jgi:hypothetical protein